MPLERADRDLAMRHLEAAMKHLELRTSPETAAIREVIHLSLRRLSPGDFYAGDAAPEITLLRHCASRTTACGARIEILKAVDALWRPEDPAL